MVVLPYLAPIIGDGRLQRLAPHHRAVHLLGWQAIEKIRDILIAHLQRLIQGHALDHLGQRRGGGNRRTAAEGLKTGIEDHVGLGIDLEGQTQGITAGDRADLADTIGLGHRPGIARVEKVFLNLLGIFPHDTPLLRPRTTCRNRRRQRHWD